MTIDNPLWSYEELKAATNGQILKDDQVTAFPNIQSVTIDSRRIKPHDLFIAIKGPQHDGHQFIQQAFDAGAALCMIDNQDFAEKSYGPYLYVSNTENALTALGKFARNRTEAKIVGITGSVGKTTVKEALKLICSKYSKTCASIGNFNNHYGLPLSLAHMNEATKFGIFELGMSNPGEIRHLGQITKPHIVTITKIAPAHIGAFNHIDEIADAKAEIFENTADHPQAILNADCDYFEYLKAKAKQNSIKDIISFGKNAKDDIQLLEERIIDQQTSFKIRLWEKEIEFLFPHIGPHWYSIILNVLSIASLLKIDIEDAAQLLTDFQPVKGRGQKHILHNQDITLIDESYNANPTSMKACIKSLAEMDPQHQRRRVAILGDMCELGQNSPQYHLDLAPVLEENNIDCVFLCGEEMKVLYDNLHTKIECHYAQSSSDLNNIVLDHIQKGDLMAVKASNAVKISIIVEHILERENSINPNHHNKAAHRAL